MIISFPQISDNMALQDSRYFYPSGKGKIVKIFLQLFWWSPGFHLRQIYRNAKNPSFWNYGFEKNELVKRHTLQFWKWWSLNRDMEHTEECPGWQWWYYDIEGWGWHLDSKEPRKVTLNNYRKFPVVRTAQDKKFRHNGVLFTLFSTYDEALNAK